MFSAHRDNATPREDLDVERQEYRDTGIDKNQGEVILGLITLPHLT